MRSKIFTFTHSAHLLKKIQAALHESCMMVLFSFLKPTTTSSVLLGFHFLLHLRRHLHVHLHKVHKSHYLSVLDNPQFSF